MPALKIEAVDRQILDQIFRALGGGKRVYMPSIVDVRWPKEVEVAHPFAGIVRVAWENPRATVWGYLEGEEAPPNGCEVTVLALHGRLSCADSDPRRMRKHVETPFPGIGVGWLWEGESGGQISFNIWIGRGAKARKPSLDQGAIMGRLQAEEAKEQDAMAQVAQVIASLKDLE